MTDEHGVGSDGLPPRLAEGRELGRVADHVCVEIERGIVGYWLVGHFARRDLDALTRLAWDSVDGGEYVSIAFTERLERYDPDLRTVATEPGELRLRRAKAAIVLSAKPLERMVVQTMSLAGKAVGKPAGELVAEADLDAAIVRARALLRAR